MGTFCESSMDMVVTVGSVEFSMLAMFTLTFMVCPLLTVAGKVIPFMVTR